MKVYYDRGIVVEADGKKLYLDPELASTPIKHPSFVTHAHSDHTAAISGGSLTYLNQTTIDLYESTHSKTPRNYKIVEMKEPFEVGNFQVEYKNAGHLLGAAQILIRHGSSSFLYTGDFCPEDLLTVKGADLPSEEMDLTIIDSTYGDQYLHFEDRQQSRQNLFVWVLSQLNMGNIPVINIGHLGGAQEIIKMFNQLMEKLPIVVHDKVDRVAKVFQQNGIVLRYHTFSDPDITTLLEEKCLILMPRSFKKIEDLEHHHPQLKGRLTRAMVTGQTAKYGFSAFNFTSALSTHAHFEELIETTRILNPKHVLTHFGHHEKFAKYLISEQQVSASSFMNSEPVEIETIEFLRKRILKPHNIFRHRPLDDFF